MSSSSSPRHFETPQTTYQSAHPTPIPQTARTHLSRSPTTPRSLSDGPTSSNSGNTTEITHQVFRITRPTAHCPGGDIAVPWDWLHGDDNINWDTRIDPDLIKVRDALDDLATAMRKLIQDHSDFNHDPRRISDVPHEQESYYADFVQWFTVTAPAELVLLYVQTAKFWSEGNPGTAMMERHPMKDVSEHWYGEDNRINRVFSPLLRQWNDLFEWCESFAASEEIVKCLNPQGRGAKRLAEDKIVVDLGNEDVVALL